MVYLAHYWVVGNFSMVGASPNNVQETSEYSQIKT